MNASNPARAVSDFYHGTPQQIAKQLLGSRLVRCLDCGTRVSGIVVEVEAYLADNDSASHSSRGPNRKNNSMFQQAGTLYVYSIHSRHCLNVVTEKPGQGSAILIRALEPCEGIPKLSANRKTTVRAKSRTAFLRHLTTGPGRLCEALQVDRSHDGANLTASSQIWFEPAPPEVQQKNARAISSGRIGVSSAQQLKLRWFFDGNLFVSGCANEHSAGRTWSFQDLTQRPD